MTPDHHTIEERLIAVGDGHKLYAQLWGNKNAAETIVFLHGGPGSGCNDKHKSIFDPLRQRVVFLDQRGCGKSVPYGSLEANTTDQLVEDINAVTQAFGVKKFAIAGGSWGRAWLWCTPFVIRSALREWYYAEFLQAAKRKLTFWIRNTTLLKLPEQPQRPALRLKLRLRKPHQQLPPSSMLMTNMVSASPTRRTGSSPPTSPIPAAHITKELSS